MQRSVWKFAGIMALLMAVLALAPNVSAFHGAWWRGFGTAVSGPDTYNAEFFWGGQTAILACPGNGCIGSGTGTLTIRDDAGQTVLIQPYAGVEDVSSVAFTNDPDFCPSQVGWPDPLEVTAPYKLVFGTGQLTGIQRNCLSTGINRNDFNGSSGTFVLTIHAEGGFGVSHG